jgi:hypothetical protein
VLYEERGATYHIPQETKLHAASLNRLHDIKFDSAINYSISSSPYHPWSSHTRLAFAYYSCFACLSGPSQLLFNKWDTIMDAYACTSSNQKVSGIKIGSGQDDERWSILSPSKGRSQKRGLKRATSCQAELRVSMGHRHFHTCAAGWPGFGQWFRWVCSSSPGNQWRAIPLSMMAKQQQQQRREPFAETKTE